VDSLPLLMSLSLLMDRIFFFRVIFSAVLWVGLKEMEGKNVCMYYLFIHPACCRVVLECCMFMQMTQNVYHSRVVHKDVSGVAGD
jgi:hypothetical protein